MRFRPLILLVAAASLFVGRAQEHASNLRLFEWERGFAVESLTEKGMAVYLWFYEWNMFDAMERGEHTRGTFRLQRALSGDGQTGMIESDALTLKMTLVSDGAKLELTVRNRTDYDFPPLAAIIPCFNPGPEPARNRQLANTNTYFLSPAGLEKLWKREIHFNDRLREEVDLQARDGQYVWTEKWPLAEPNAAFGLIVRESTNGKWVCGIAWEDFLSAQGHNPWECMHLSVRVGPLRRGESKTIRGRIYLLPGNKEEILKRFRKDFGAQ